LHGGTVSAHSAGTGQGARFEVCLLRVPRVTAGTVSSPETETDGHDRSGTIGTVGEVGDAGKPGQTV